MAVPLLVISHPPHGEVDPELAAPVLGISPVDVRLKAHHPVPEIWLAASTPEAAAARAATLRRAGLWAVVVPGQALAETPGCNPVVSFSFEERELLLCGHEEVRLGYDLSVIGVLFTPRPGEGRGTAPLAFLDLYAVPGGRVGRWTFLQGTTGFEGMGDRKTASFGMNVHAFAADIEQRFAKSTIDKRLVNLQVRRRLGAPPPGTARHGYSFATTALNELLEAIRPGLSMLEHEDLTSRLAFLTHAGA
jgi:hypothetical protein